MPTTTCKTPPGRSFPLTAPCFGGSRKQGWKEWTGKLRNLFKGSKKTPSKGQPVGMLPWVPVGEQCQSRAQERCPDWVLKEKGGTWNPEKSEFLCLAGVLNTHTQSKRGSCAHPPRGLHHFSEHREYKTSFRLKTNTTIIKKKCRIQTFGCSMFRNRRKKN